MLLDDVQIISVDDHVVEPPNVWQDRLPAKFKELGPRNEQRRSGSRPVDVRRHPPL